jgi:1,4-dihydroxy-6-naphthoate synthase
VSTDVLAHKVALSPISNDFFVAAQLLDSCQLNVLDQPHLNALAHEGFDGLIKVSAVAVPELLDRYRVVLDGAAFAYKGSPHIVTRQGEALPQLLSSPLWVPGTTTTAFWLVQRYLKGVTFQVAPYEVILPSLLSGKASWALLIHEDATSYDPTQFQCVMDLGQRWSEDTTSLLPLGVFLIRRTLPTHLQEALIHRLQKSLEWSLGHHKQAVERVASRLKLSLTETARGIESYLIGVPGHKETEGLHELFKAMGQPLPDDWLWDR